MDSNPIRGRSGPGYPTRREFLAGGAAALLAVAGCGRGDRAHAVVAPIFEHGEGRGACGCIVMSPPVFLSEEEALQVLREELARRGITLGEGRQLAGVEIEWVAERQQSARWLGEPRERKTYSVVLGGVDEKNRVGIEFVSTDSYDRLTSESFGTAGSFDTKKAAERVAAEIRRQSTDDLRIGVFYDPMTNMEFVFRDESEKPKKKDKAVDTSTKQWECLPEESDEAATAKSKLLLRRQAQDFAAWLKRC